VKKTGLVILLLSLYVGIFAITGLYNLSFGEKYKVTNTILKKQGILSNQSPIKALKKQSSVSVVCYPKAGNTSELQLSRIVLYYVNNSPLLDSWLAYYVFPQTDKSDKIMLEKVTNLHGNDYYRDKDAYYWTLDENHYVTMGYVSDSYFIYYVTGKHLRP
jgi:hypothetical protein